ncbi:hypothetical protein SKAU_G00053560 [Synaphobranchus kaupii]|uniref:Uncharacterized protein n=1 Tax=Synaphobranchus kaupii TaxID=118154 RepID=A0A9Q1J8V9_SYNKA|nr:hypothetical protein SKAU_G00053560 [Synaphobranchus kaupii]
MTADSMIRNSKVLACRKGANDRAFAMVDTDSPRWARTLRARRLYPFYVKTVTWRLRSAFCLHSGCKLARMQWSECCWGSRQSVPKYFPR